MAGRGLLVPVEVGVGAVEGGEAATEAASSVAAGGGGPRRSRERATATPQLFNRGTGEQRAKQNERESERAV